jgi:hypothetical protein
LFSLQMPPACAARAIVIATGEPRA